MKTIAVAATLVGLAAAAPAAAGYHFVTVDGPGPATLATIVDAINDGGVATGYVISYDPNVPAGAIGDYSGFTVNADGSNFTAFSRPGYAQTGASGINNAGDVSGVSITAGGTGNGFIRSGATGAYTDVIPTFAGSYYSEAIGINNSGGVAGYYVTDPAATVATLEQYSHGYVEVGGAFVAVDVDPVIGHGTQVDSINDLGVFTGSYIGNGDGFDHPFAGRIDPATLAVSVIPLPADPFGAPSSAIGNITDNFLTTYDSLFPTPLSPTGFAAASYVVDLAHGGLTPIAVPGAFFTTAFGINVVGQVTGYYVDALGLHGFIATAVPEPSSWLLMIAGFGLVGAAVRRRSVRATQG